MMAPNGLLWLCEECGWSTPRDARTPESEMVCCRCQSPTVRAHLGGYENVRVSAAHLGGYIVEWNGKLLSSVVCEAEARMRRAELNGREV